MKGHWHILLGLALLLMGCGSPAPATSTRVAAQAASATPSISPTPTLLPTSTATQIPITPAAIGTQLPKAGAIISRENANQLRLVARWGNGNAGGTQYTPNGEYLVVAYSTGIYFYNASDFSFAKVIDLHTAIFNLLMSPDGKTMVVTTLDKAFLIDTDNDTAFFRIDASVVSMAFSSDSKTLALGVHPEKGDLIQFWDVDNRKVIREFSSDGGWMVRWWIVTGLMSLVVGLSISPSPRMGPSWQKLAIHAQILSMYGGSWKMADW